jgi:hypothetical protein
MILFDKQPHGLLEPGHHLKSQSVGYPLELATQDAEKNGTRGEGSDDRTWTRKLAP